MSGMKIAHCQFESWNADFERNLRRFEEGLAFADAAGAAIVEFNREFREHPDAALAEAETRAASARGR